MSSTKHTPERCCHTMRRGSKWNRRDVQCLRAATVTEDGKCWCKQHAPTVAKARRDAGQQKLDARWAAATANRNRRNACVNAMQGIDDPAAFRKCFEKLVQALEESIQYSPYKGESEETPFLRRARAALQSAKSLTKRGA